MAETVTSRVVGTPGDDVLVDTPGDTVLNGLDGNDVLDGQFGDGNDIFLAGDGADIVVGGEGNDRILGGDGVDFLRGVVGNDVLYGEAGSDTLIGEAGDDTILGGDGDDFIFLDDLGDGLTFGRVGNNFADGGAGNDRIIGGDGNDFILGGDGAEAMNSGAGNDIVYGGAGNDQFTGFGGDDEVYGDSGDDLVDGGEGNDRVFGGEGNDILLGTSPINSQPDRDNGQIDTLTGNAGTDTFILGTVLPNGTKSIFYDDEDITTAGTGDYALIADFGWGSPAGEDRDLILLNGSANDYSLGAAPAGLPSGTGIFFNDGSTSELLAIVAEVSPSDLSLNNVSQFTFLGEASSNPEPVETPPKLKMEVVASGLNSPRKLSFGPDGALYVAEAGRGGTGASIPSPSQPGAVLSYGATGAIARIQNGVVERVVTELPSLALPDGSDAAGVNAIDFDAAGNAYAIVGFASNPANRDSIIQVPDFSQLIAIDNFGGGSSWTRLIDFGAYEQTNNPDGQDVNTNLYDLLIEDNTAYVLDAGGNDLLSQRAFGGELTLETVFPTRTMTDPLTGESVVRQSVPTSITVGPDGAFYVSELTGFPYEAGTAQVYRLNAEGQPEVYAEGFTNIVDLAFDKSGGLYVLEYDADGILNGSDAGALIYVSSDGQTRTTITNELFTPTGLEIAPDGDIYISNKGFVAGQGEVLRLSQDTSTLDQGTANGSSGRWSDPLLQTQLLGDRGAFDSVYKTRGDLDPNVNKTGLLTT